jgi:hypothetical protein
MRGIPDQKIASFFTSKRGFLAIPKAAFDQLAKSPQSSAAIAARNGWKQILRECAPLTDLRSHRRDATPKTSNNGRQLSQRPRVTEDRASGGRHPQDEQGR